MQSTHTLLGGIGAIAFGALAITGQSALAAVLALGLVVAVASGAVGSRGDSTEF